MTPLGLMCSRERRKKGRERGKEGGREQEKEKSISYWLITPFKSYTARCIFVSSASKY
jgi:hypothetical protein